MLLDSPSESLFDPVVRARVKELTGHDPEDSYNEMLLDIKVGGPVSQRLIRMLGMVGPSLERQNGTVRREADSHEAIRNVLSTTRRQAEREAKEREAKPKPLFGPAQVKVLRLMAQGLDNQEAAASLHLSIETIKSHLKNSRNTIGARTTTQCVLVALVLGYFTPEP